MKRICVFAGSNPGNVPDYVEAAEQLGKELAVRDLELVYGGSRIGLMGRVADAVLMNGGRAVGVMPKGLFRGEMVHTGLTELHEVENMHERKAMMYELADAFIALPGGLGTFEELFEVLSWSQLGIHQKPIGLQNTRGFYSALNELVANAVRAGFAREENMNLFIISENISELVDGLYSFQRPQLRNKWNEL